MVQEIALACKEQRSEFADPIKSYGKLCLFHTAVLQESLTVPTNLNLISFCLA